MIGSISDVTVGGATLEPISTKETLLDAKIAKVKREHTHAALTTDVLPNRLKRSVSTPLKRSNSLPDLKKLKPIESKEEAIQRVSGELWECFDRTLGPHGGFIYHFRMKPEFTMGSGKSKDEVEAAINRKMDAIFPAVEANLSRLDEIFFDNNGGYHPLLQNLGYSCDKKTGILLLPDHEALKKGWTKLQQTYPQLLDLDIVSSEGVADDFSYINSYLTNDVLLSTGREFVHDHLFHVISIVRLLSTSLCRSQKSEGMTYPDIKAGILKHVLRCLRRLEWAKIELLPKDADVVMSNNVRITKHDLKMIETSIAAVVDGTAAYSRLDDEDPNQPGLKFGDRFFLQPVDIFTYSGYDIFANRLYADTNLNVSHLREVWQELGRLEKVYLDKLLADRPLAKMNHPFYQCIAEKSTSHGKLYTFKVNERYIGNDEKTAFRVRAVLKSDYNNPITPLALRCHLRPESVDTQYVSQVIDEIQLNQASTTSIPFRKIKESIKRQKDGEYDISNPDACAVYSLMKQKHPAALQKSKYLQMLGYDYQITDEGEFFVVPDRSELAHNWQELQKLEPTLTKLDKVIQNRALTGTHFLQDHFQGPIQVIMFADFLSDEEIY